MLKVLYNIAKNNCAVNYYVVPASINANLSHILKSNNYDIYF